MDNTNEAGLSEGELLCEDELEMLNAPSEYRSHKAAIRNTKIAALSLTVIFAYAVAQEEFQAPSLGELYASGKASLCETTSLCQNAEVNAKDLQP